jgi:hypothetical protein
MGLVNDGDPCTLQATLVTPQVRIKLLVPSHLEGAWDRREQAQIRLRLTGSQSPTIGFFRVDNDELHPLDPAFGGSILWVETDQHRMMFRTSSKGCVGVTF